MLAKLLTGKPFVQHPLVEIAQRIIAKRWCHLGIIFSRLGIEHQHRLGTIILANTGELRLILQLQKNFASSAMAEMMRSNICIGIFLNYGSRPSSSKSISLFLMGGFTCVQADYTLILLLHQSHLKLSLPGLQFFQPLLQSRHLFFDNPQLRLAVLLHQIISTKLFGD